MLFLVQREAKDLMNTLLACIELKVLLSLSVKALKRSNFHIFTGLFLPCVRQNGFF